jgi:hypothetical protein
MMCDRGNAPQDPVGIPFHVQHAEFPRLNERENAMIRPRSRAQVPRKAEVISGSQPTVPEPDELAGSVSSARRLSTSLYVHL